MSMHIAYVCAYVCVYLDGQKRKKVGGAMVKMNTKRILCSCQEYVHLLKGMIRLEESVKSIMFFTQNSF